MVVRASRMIIPLIGVKYAKSQILQKFASKFFKICKINLQNCKLINYNLIKL